MPRDLRHPSSLVRTGNEHEPVVADINDLRKQVYALALLDERDEQTKPTPQVLQHGEGDVDPPLRGLHRGYQNALRVNVPECPR